MISKDKPEFLLAAEELAEKRGTSWAEVLDEDREAARRSGYPGPECLVPDEIERFVADGHLAAGRAEHATSCPACASLLVSARGDDPAELRRILAQVRDRSRPPSVGRTGGSAGLRGLVRWPAVLGFAAVTALVYKYARRLSGKHRSPTRASSAGQRLEKA